MKHLLLILCFLIFSCDSGGGGEVEGCTDVEATNFNQLATIDNDLCIYDEFVTENDFPGDWEMIYVQSFKNINGQDVLDYTESTPFNLCIISEEWLQYWLSIGGNINECPKSTVSFSFDENLNVTGSFDILGIDYPFFFSGSMTPTSDITFIMQIQMLFNGNYDETVCDYEIQEIIDNVLVLRYTCDDEPGYTIERWQKSEVIQ